jgi:hypothetical protein
MKVRSDVEERLQGCRLADATEIAALKEQGEAWQTSQGNFDASILLAESLIEAAATTTRK